MDITVIGMIKNAADIIESYIRANGLFADRFVLIDNNSTDNTGRILAGLIAEGYNIDIIPDSENAYLQSMKMNVLIQRVAASYDTDWIIPLDDDEILLGRDGKNVRDVISAWDEDCAYYSPERTYIPTEEDDPGEICIIRREQFMFAERLSGMPKIAFSRKLALSGELRIVQGNHDITGIEVKKCTQPDLVIAHFPVRSKEQIISKALVGWTNYLAMPFRRDRNGAHWERIYERFKKSFDVDIDMMWELSFLYLKDTAPDELEIERVPLDIDEKGFEIRYTTANEIDPILNYIENTENLAKAYEKLLTEKMTNNGSGA